MRAGSVSPLREHFFAVSEKKLGKKRFNRYPATKQGGRFAKKAKFEGSGAPKGAPGAVTGHHRKLGQVEFISGSIFDSTG